MENSSAIELIGLEKTLDNKKVLDGLTLSIKKGETIAVIGGSGTGKTVTLKSIVGLIKPDGGKIIIDGVDIVANPKALTNTRKKIGFLFQNAALLNSLNVMENVALPLREHEILNEDEIISHVKDVLALVGLKDMENKMPETLSGGMKKRVGLARAIVRQPEILLYDEPNAGLDPVVTSTISDLILDMQKKLNVTSIVVTHDMTVTSRVANRVAMLYQGKVVKLGEWKEFENSNDPLIKQFITGSSTGPLTD